MFVYTGCNTFRLRGISFKDDFFYQYYIFSTHLLSWNARPTSRYIVD